MKRRYQVVEQTISPLEYPEPPEGFISVESLNRQPFYMVFEADKPGKSPWYRFPTTVKGFQAVVKGHVVGSLEITLDGVTPEPIYRIRHGQCFSNHEPWQFFRVNLQHVEPGSEFSLLGCYAESMR